MKQEIPEQPEFYESKQRAYLFSVMHTGTTFWAQILQALNKKGTRYRGFLQNHIIDRVPGYSRPGVLIATMRHPLATAISWKNTGLFKGDWSDELTTAWRILCQMIPTVDYVLSVDAPNRDELLQRFLDDHNFNLSIDWDRKQNATAKGSDLRHAYERGDYDFIFKHINRIEYERLFEMTKECFPHYVPEGGRDIRRSQGVVSEGFASAQAG